MTKSNISRSMALCPTRRQRYFERNEYALKGVISFGNLFWRTHQATAREFSHFRVPNLRAKSSTNQMGVALDNWYQLGTLTTTCVDSGERPEPQDRSRITTISSKVRRHI